MSERVARTRERLQAHIDGLEPRIRRRLRGKLRAIERGVYDLDDVLSSVRRRVDTAASAGRIAARSRVELDAYILRVAERVALQELRRERRRRRRWWQVATYSADVTIDPVADDDDAGAGFDRLVHALEGRDRVALDLWARGLSHRHIAKALSIDFEAHRSQWRRLRTRLRKLAAADEPGTA